METENTDFSALVARIESLEKAIEQALVALRSQGGGSTLANGVPATGASAPLEGNIYECTIGEPCRAWASGQGGFYRVEARCVSGRPVGWHRWVSLGVRSPDYLAFPAGTKLRVEGRVQDDSARTGRESYTLWADHIDFPDVPAMDAPAEPAPPADAELGDEEDDFPW